MYVINKILLLSLLGRGHRRERERERESKSPILSKGFTLLELLVVIGIIAILSTIAVAALNTARAKARDVKRMHDLRVISKALDMYYADYGYYPHVSGFWFTSGYYSSDWDNDFKNELKDYIAELPVPPINDGMAPYEGDGYTYVVNSGGSKYELVTLLETDNPLRCPYKDYISYTSRPLWRTLPPIRKI